MSTELERARQTMQRWLREAGMAGADAMVLIFERLIREETIEACAQIVPKVIERRKWQNNPYGLLASFQLFIDTGEAIAAEIRSLALPPAQEVGHES